MPRIRFVAALAAALTLALAGVASAAVTKVTGGTTQLTVSSGALTLLTDNHITPKVLAPATLSGATVTFPISGGHLNTTNLHGVINHRGGIELSNGTKSVTLRSPTLISSSSGVSLDALVRGKTVRRCHRVGGPRHRRMICTTVVRYHTARIARVTNLKLTNGTATGTVNITQFTANAINALAGKNVATAGAVLGTATVKPTLA